MSATITALLSKHGRLFLCSLCFLTIIPLPARWLGEADKQTQPIGELLYYPFVGALIGLCLFAVGFVFAGQSAWLVAAVTLTVWVAITGALHLDGLADSADAWLGGHGDRIRSLQILKDTHAGVAAIVALILLLLLKFVCLVDLAPNMFYALLFAPVLARIAAVVLLLTTDYVRENGIAAVTLTSFSALRIGVVIGLLILLLCMILKWHAVFILATLVIAFVIYRIVLVRWLGGTTGDTAGALIELVELLVLFDFVLIGPRL